MTWLGRGAAWLAALLVVKFASKSKAAPSPPRAPGERERFYS